MEYTQRFLPEGDLIDTAENQAAIATLTGLMQAKDEGRLLEGRAVRCDVEHNLYVRLPCGEGIIPHNEGALGIAEGVTKDIVLITRVNKPVCFVVIGFEQTEQGCRPILSRRLAQQRCREEFLDHLQLGDIIPARITRLESFGAFCDIGCGLPALLPIADISVSRILHPRDRLTVGMEILGVVSSLENNRICLSHRELLGTWEENASRFLVGETVAGIVRSVEPYGIFVELAPNLAGLAEPHPDVKVGQQAAVYIKSVQPEKLKIKLALIDAQDNDQPPPQPEYFITEGPLLYWRYSPEECSRVVERRFREE
ncbi:MAG: S1 RNA-binding domain-containing protein [Clostridia bacterium]|nr:S1 RNA-binding domain-containing protein [Clostridia bacterium]